MKKHLKSFNKRMLILFLLASLLFFFYACSNTATSDFETGSIVFDIEWPTDVPRSAQALNNPSIDCDAAGITLVNVDVYEATDLWLNGESFECSIGAGTVRDIPSGSNRSVVINAKDANEAILYQGTMTGVTVSPGQINDVGTVQLGSVDPNMDSDGDGVNDDQDNCPNTQSGAQVDDNGCTLSPAIDSDGDGVTDELDNCPNTPSGTQVDASGCPIVAGDGDNDGVPDDQDSCPNSPSGDVVGTDGCSILRFTDMGDGTVKDNNSGLIWLKDASCNELAGTDENGGADWTTANEVAAANLANGTCGLSDDSSAGDWRLPTKEEWEAFVDTGYYDPALCNASGDGQWTEGDAFTGVPSTTSPYCWSSTEYDTSNAWLMGIRTGSMTNTTKDNDYYVWPVRSDN